MSSTTDLVGAIGTWVAVILAIIALFGVLGPLLVWRASRTVRYKAVAALEAGNAENGGYVTRGIHVGPDIRLFRKVRAPSLRKTPILPESNIVWDPAVLLPSADSAGWVQFGHVLDAYHVEYRTGDCILIEEGHAFLPLSRHWLYVVGLLGRFSHRKDKGKWPKAVSMSAKSIQARPGQYLNVISGRYGSHIEPPTPGWMTSRAPRSDWNRMNEYRTAKNTLCGVMGCLKFKTRRFDARDGDLQGADEAQFFAYTQDEAGDLSVEPLSIDKLFWLSVGCIPLSDGRVLSLENVQIQSTIDEPDDTPEPVLPSMATPSPAVHFDVDDDFENDVRYGFPERTYHHVPALLSPTYVVAAQTPQHGGGARNRKGPHKFRLSPTVDRMESLLDLAHIVGAESKHIRTLSLEEVELTSDEEDSLVKDAGRTYIPCDRQWIRLGPKVDAGSSASSPWFLQRADAQLLAYALLQLPLCPHGYLIYKPEHSACRKMLVQASDMFPLLLTRILPRIDNFGLGQAEVGELKIAMQSMWACVSKSENNRVFCSTLYTLDQALSKVRKGDEVANLAIQALTLTNAEFRDLITQTLRRIDEGLHSSMSLDLKKSTIDIITVMGLVQHFAVDLDVLVSKPAKDGQLVIPYTRVMLLVLQASLRSTVLETSMDSLPLFQQVLGLTETVWMP